MSDEVPEPRVLVTRAAEDATVLAHYLMRHGLQPVRVPLLQRNWCVEEIAALDLDGFDLVILTSATSADVLAAARPTWPDHVQFGVVGPATARRARTLGLPVDVQPERALGIEMVSAMGDVAGKRILYPKSDLAPPTVAEALRSGGAEVTEVVAYVNISPEGHEAQLLEALPVDATTLMSGSAAERLASVVPPAHRSRLGKVVAIGPTTARVAKSAGLHIHHIAQPHSIAGLVDAVRAFFPMFADEE